MINIYLFKLDNRSTDSLTLLRYLLAEKYHLSEDAIHIHHNEYGKPSVTLSEHKDLYFSISHAKATTVIAISDTPIGIDAEYITALSPDSISHFLTEDERQYCTDSLHTLEIWTKKEAVSKYLGYGLNMNFSSFSVLDTEKNYALYSFVQHHIIISVCCPVTLEQPQISIL